MKSFVLDAWIISSSLMGAIILYLFEHMRTLKHNTGSHACAQLTDHNVGFVKIMSVEQDLVLVILANLIPWPLCLQNFDESIYWPKTK